MIRPGWPPERGGWALSGALSRAAVAVKRSSLLLLSRAYRHGDPVEKLFTLVDKTDEVDKRAQVFEHDVDAVDAAVRAEEPPQPVLNRACWRCDFFKASCLGSGRGHTVVELPKLHHTRIKALFSPWKKAVR